MALYFEENLKIYVEKLYFMKKEAFLSSVSFESIIIRAQVKKTTSNQTYLGNDSGFMIAGQLAGRFITAGPRSLASSQLLLISDPLTAECTMFFTSVARQYKEK